MSFKSFFSHFATLGLVATVFSCTSCNRGQHEHTEPDTQKTGTLTVEFDNIAGDQNLVLGTEYTNAAGETFKVSTLKYYISNLILTDSKGNTYTVPQENSYFLVDESQASSQQVKLTLPEGDYKDVSFMLGVDSTRNTMDISKRTGVLDPAAGGAGMYWTWNSGYIHFKLEGTSSASTAQGNAFRYHIGGYGGQSASSKTVNNTRLVKLTFGGNTAAVRADHTDTAVHLLVDVRKAFGSLRIADGANVMALNATSASIADNCQSMFRFDHVHSH